MTTKTKAAEQTLAEVVEPSGASLVLTQVQPGLDIEGNFAALQMHVEKLVRDYQGVQITEEYVPQAKHDRAYLNGLAKDIDSRRLEVKRQYSAPIVAFEDRIKVIIAPIKEASAAIDAQIKAFEESDRANKRVELVKHWDEYAGVLADAVPFTQIEDPKWSLKSTSLMSAFEAIEALVEKIAADDAALTGLNLSHPNEAKAEYLATLDMSKAIARSKQLDEQEARAAALEAEKQAIAAAREAEKPEPVAEVAQPAPAPAKPATREWTFTCECTREELDGVLDYLKAHGIHGKVR